MRAMLLTAPKTPLKLTEVPTPTPGKGQILLQVHACGVCRTDLHVYDGELPHPKLPLTIGHQIVGTVVQLGEGVEANLMGTRRGVPWLGGSCGHCRFCTTGQENLCDNAVYTGYHVDGGYAEYCVANAAYTFPIPEGYSDLHAAPLLCAGLIGYRSYKLAGSGKRLGFYGFGAAAHLMIQLANYQGREVYAFTRPGDHKTQKFAKEMGAVWAGDSTQKPPQPLDGAIIFASDGTVVPLALQALDKGATAVCAGIHMSDIPSFPYDILWEERVLRSVANLTREDGREYLALAPKVPIESIVTAYPLERANDALEDLRKGRFSGSAVLQISLISC